MKSVVMWQSKSDVNSFAGHGFTTFEKKQVSSWGFESSGLMFVLQGAFVCDMILLYLMNTSSFYRERKFEIINFKYGTSFFCFFPPSPQWFLSPSCKLFFFLFLFTEKRKINRRTIKQAAGIGDPEKPAWIKMQPTLSENRRKLN